MSELEKIPTQEAVPASNESAMETSEQSGSLEVPVMPEKLTTASAEHVPAASASTSTANGSSIEKDATTKSVESVLEDGLGDTYKKLSPEVKEKFRSEGEKVTTEIAEMVRKTQVKAQKVLKLIREWLKIIPHINNYFLDQEAKIKTDRIMHLSDEENQEIV